MQDKLRLKIEQLARLALAHASNADMMRYSGLTQSGLSRILALPEFKEQVARLQAQLMSHGDAVLQRKLDQTLRVFDDAVPEALQALVDTVKQNRDLKARMLAAREILNRDPASRAVEPADRTSGASFAGASLPQGVLDNTLRDAAPLSGLTPVIVSEEPAEVDAASRLAEQQAAAGKVPV